MEFVPNLTAESDDAQLSNEMIFRRYQMNRVNLKHLFQDLSLVEYIVMCISAQRDREHPLEPNKVYLEKIAESLHIPVYQASRIVGNLRDRGLLTWTHDGDGSEGTYVMITEMGRMTVEKQEGVIKEFYGRVIRKFGKEKFIRLLYSMNKLENIMNEEIGEIEGVSYDE